METKTMLLNHGRDGEVELTHSPVRTRGPMKLLPGQGEEGYGDKITLPWTAKYAGRVRRLYCTQHSNAGTWWFTHRGRRMIVS